MPEPPYSVIDAYRLHKRRRRGGGSGGPAAARSLRILPAGLPRHRRGPRILLAKTEQLPQRAQAALLLGNH